MLPSWAVALAGTALRHLLQQLPAASKQKDDVVIEDAGEEPINLDDILF